MGDTTRVCVVYINLFPSKLLYARITMRKMLTQLVGEMDIYRALCSPFSLPVVDCRAKKYLNGILSTRGQHKSIYIFTNKISLVYGLFSL